MSIKKELVILIYFWPYFVGLEIDLEPITQSITLIAVRTTFSFCGTSWAKLGWAVITGAIITVLAINSIGDKGALVTMNSNYRQDHDDLKNGFNR